MPDTQETLDKMASEIFELYLLIAIARSRQPAGDADLSETEFLTLDILSKEEPLTIGEVQKHIGVVPAQMSRIVRALEVQGGKGYVETKINATDRRRIDLYLTDAGRKAHATFRDARLHSMYQVLNALPSGDRLQFMKTMHLLRSAFEKQVFNN